MTMRNDSTTKAGPGRVHNQGRGKDPNKYKKKVYGKAWLKRERLVD